MKKTVLLSTITLLLLLALPASTVMASSSSSKNAADLMWGNGTLWQMLKPPANNSASAAGTHSPAEELYFVANQTDTAQTLANSAGSKLSVGYDHVISTPPDGHGTYNANWHVYIVKCLTSECTSVQATILANGKTINLAQTYNGMPLESDSVIQAGVMSGALGLIDTGVTFVCPVSPVW